MKTIDDLESDSKFEEDLKMINQSRNISPGLHKRASL